MKEEVSLLTCTVFLTSCLGSKGRSVHKENACIYIGFECTLVQNCAKSSAYVLFDWGTIKELFVCAQLME